MWYVPMLHPIQGLVHVGVRPVLSYLFLNQHTIYGASERIIIDLH